MDVWTGVQGNGPTRIVTPVALRTDAKSADGGFPAPTASTLTYVTRDGVRELLRSDAALRAEVKTFVRRLTVKAAKREGVAIVRKHPRGSRNSEVVKSEGAWAVVGDATGVFTEK